jgi:hypothetical protein
LKSKKFLQILALHPNQRINEGKKNRLKPSDVTNHPKLHFAKTLASSSACGGGRRFANMEGA